MKRLTALFFAALAGICLGCQKAPAGESAKQPQAMARPAQALVDDEQAAAAALRFLDRLDEVLEYQSDFTGPLEDYPGNVKRSMDKKKMEFSLYYETPDPANGPFSISVKVYRPTADQNPKVYFPDLDLAVETALNTPKSGTPYSSRPLTVIIDETLFVLRMAEPSVGGRAAGMLEPMVVDIKDEISKLSDKHPALRNFEQEAVMYTNRDTMEYGVIYSHNIGDSTMRNPNGEMLGPDSIYVSFYVNEYIPLMSRYTVGNPERHEDFLLKNLNLEASWNIETHDPELPGVIYRQIIEPRLKQLKQLDDSIAK